MSHIVGRALTQLLEQARSGAAALGALRRSDLEAADRRHCELAQAANAKVVSLLTVISELQTIEEGRLELAPQPRRLRELMDEVEDRWRAEADSAGVTFMVSYDGDPECSVMVDWQRLLLVIDALVARALVSVRQGVVEASLATRIGESSVGVSCLVRDDGPGFAGDKIGDLGSEEAPAADRVDLGVVLGLRLAERLVEAMGGRLELRPNVGHGATLSFEVAFNAPRPADQNPGVHAPGGTGAHVLVVDDNATNRMVVEALCEMFECSSDSVADGLEAVEAVRSARYDVILMDIKMPRMDGLEATKVIRGLAGPAGRLPIIALTANAGPEDVKTYLAAGMCDVVEKPIKADRLLKALEDALASARLSDDESAAAA